MNKFLTIHNSIKLIFPVFFCFLFNSNLYSQSGWIQQNSGVSSNLNSVKFKNSQIGWCVGDNGKLLKSTNGGLNWQIKTLSTKNFKAITFPSEYTGYIVGEKGIFLKTTDQGMNWQDISFQNTTLNCTFFIDDSVGFIGTDSSVMYKTLNGGNDWILINIANYLTIDCIYFLDHNTGWFTGFSFGCKVSKTIDGFTWNCQPIAGPDIKVRSVFFTDSQTGYLGTCYSQQIGNIPTIFVTTNGGSNWYDPFRYTNNLSYSLFFTDLNNGWSAGNYGLIWHTTNKGLNWTQQTPFVSGLIYRSIYFTDSLTGWCVGDSGRILKTTTGGILTNFTNTNSEIPTDYKLDQNYPNPFNPKTIINYELGITNSVSLKVYNVLGNEVATLVNEKKTAGNYEVEFDGSDIPSGIYFYRLEAGGNIIDTKRMVLLK